MKIDATTVIAITGATRGIGRATALALAERGARIAVLARDAECAHAGGQTQLAESMRQQIDRMQRQIDYHLAQARAAASGTTPGMRTPIRDSVEGLARAMGRIHAARAIGIDVACDDAHHVRVGREDLDEMLGNLLDNACKWARSRITVRSAQAADAIVISVEDDGPGLANPSNLFVPFFTTKPQGSGIGLVLGRQIAEAHGGTLTLEAREGAHGARAIVTLPI